MIEPGANPADSADTYDVVIGGGGFAGLVLALALHGAAPGAFRIAIIERTPPEKARSAEFDGRTVALTAASKHMFEVMGLWAALDPDAQPVESIDITDSELDAPARPVALHFDALLDGGEPAAFIVENRRLRCALLDALEGCKDIVMLAPESIASFDAGEGGVAARLSGGRRLDARLLAACDGRASALRDLAGVKTVEWDVGQTGIVATVAHEKPHHGRAVQHFLPSGPFAILPMTGDRSSLVWTEKNAEARRLMSLDTTSLEPEIERRFGRRLGALSLIAPPQAYPLTMNLARSYVKPRFVLVGDSAHGLHWIAGQGLNHGLKDVAALTEVLVDAARLGLDIGQLTVLKRYERWRRFDAASSAMTAAVLNRLFANDFTPLRLARDFGLGIVDRMPPLKRFFVREAAGLTGETPKMLRGEHV
jgi:2-octaprenyl-6-methoxyphenol hydroxylase